MPSKAIGVGICPRCGRPGTVVIKAGNYVYVKHGNTWHYIGTIDKVNLNKILTNKPGKAIEWRSNKKHEKRKVVESLAILSITAIIFIMLGLFYGLFFKIKIYDTKNITKINNTFSFLCYNTYNNSDPYHYVLFCNNTVYRFGNITVVEISNSNDINIVLLNKSNNAFYYNITSTK